MQGFFGFVWMCAKEAWSRGVPVWGTVTAIIYAVVILLHAVQASPMLRDRIPSPAWFDWKVPSVILVLLLLFYGVVSPYWVFAGIRDELAAFRTETDARFEAMTTSHESEIEELRQTFDSANARARTDGDAIVEQLRSQQEDELATLEARKDNQVAEIERQHDAELRQLSSEHSTEVGELEDTLSELRNRLGHFEGWRLEFELESFDVEPDEYGADRATYLVGFRITNAHQESVSLDLTLQGDVRPELGLPPSFPGYSARAPGVPPDGMENGLETPVGIASGGTVRGRVAFNVGGQGSSGMLNPRLVLRDIVSGFTTEVDLTLQPGRPMQLTIPARPNGE